VAWLLTVNLQHFELIAGQYRLQAITVNYTDNLARYESLVAELARAFPELWGYVGIDLIETPKQILVLEINPRLTSSFIGINAATGINVCTSVLQLLSGTPHLQRTRNQAIKVAVI
jgi:predicted ATP-grasp superfamily ATP-dependent carboligase